MGWRRENPAPTSPTTENDPGSPELRPAAPPYISGQTYKCYRSSCKTTADVPRPHTDDLEAHLPPSPP